MKAFDQNVIGSYSALMPAALKTLPHLSLSSTISFPNSPGVIDTGTIPS
ncbi:MAG: hypothetical protein WCB70_21780 [Xanthobacteraceae bacterium]